MFRRLASLNSRKLAILSFLGVLVFILLWWSAVYAFAYQLVEQSPETNSFLSTANPRISVRWGYTPGVNLAKAKVLLDGRDISNLVTLVPEGFSYTPRERLSEGKHAVETQLVYRFLFRRKVNLKWHFTVDTIPPEVRFSEATDAVIGTPKKNIKLNGRTEPYTKLEGTFNGKSIRMPKVKAKGRFTLTFKSLQDRNELKIVAVDRAGNKHTQVISIIFDDQPPQITALNPEDKAIVHSQHPKVSVKLEEPKTVIRSAKLIVDGDVVSVSYDSGSKTISFVPKVFFDGTHTAVVKAVDAAGNTVSRSWSFTIDSSKIVIVRTECRLYFYKGGALRASYPVAVGSSRYPTPAGRWRIIRKRKNPTWINPNVPWSQSMPDMIPPGPDNPLGQRALDLSAPGIRIHGTPSIGSVGRPVSHGCIRMYPWNIEVLFDQVTVGTPVEIK